MTYKQSLQICDDPECPACKFTALEFAKHYKEKILSEIDKKYGDRLNFENDITDHDIAYLLGFQLKDANIRSFDELTAKACAYSLRAIWQISKNTKAYLKDKNRH